MTDRRRLLELAEFIADGVDVDWNEYQRDAPAADLGVVERLATLDRLHRAMQDPQVDEPLALDRWGHLQIHDRLGHGATSTVFRAFDPALNRDVALKLWSGGTADDRAIQAWTDEAHRMARIRHPNVLAVHGAAVHDGIPGLWCELLEGETLAPHADAPRPGVDDVLSIATELLEAVITVHEAGLIHGDIKPANVIREVSGRLVLMDFGAASDLAEDSAGRDRAGTPLAMAPERFEGRPLTPAVDVFGVGVVLYALLERRYPVLGTTEAAIRGRWRRGDRPAFRHREAPHRLRRIVLSMLDPDPAARPSAEAALASIRDLRAAPKRRKKRAAIAVVFALLIGALVVSLDALRTSEQAVRENEAVRGFLTDVLSASRRTRLGPEEPMASVLEDSARIAPVQLVDQPAALADVLVTIGESLVRLQRVEEGRELFERAAVLHESLDRPIGAARVRNAQAEAARAENRVDEAAMLYQANLDTLPPGAESTALRARSWLGLGQIAVGRGNFDGAGAAYDRAMTEAIEVLGENSEMVALTRSFRGQLQLYLSRYAAALDDLEASADYYLATSGPRNRNVLVTRSSMVEALDGLDRLDEALALAQRNADVAVDWLGPSDRFTVMALDALANIETRRGRPDRALQASRQALAGLREQAAPSEELVLQFETNQIAYLLELGRAQDALVLAEDVLPRLLKVYGPGHQLVDITSLNHADALLEVGRAVEALAVARDMYRRSAAQLGEQHVFTLVSGYLAGGSLSVLGEWESAEAFLEASYVGLNEQFGTNHSLSLKASRLLGEHWLQTGDVERALAMVESAHARSIASVGPDHVRTRNLDDLRQRLMAAVRD